jgi:hypothetical protein
MPNCLRINSPKESLFLFLSASTWAENFTQMQFGMQQQQYQFTHPVSLFQIIIHNDFRAGQRIVSGTKIII